ncbi:hypothetical protein V494_00648 [Pseudogymnoascus sp. VKM F-4513 (FW-928)]|nr:hypothetical protein V494_00648 [Pseudogymnoascus sp. VKM F-4513 (FW-928)]
MTYPKKSHVAIDANTAMAASSKPLTLLIVGAGLCGLSAAISTLLAGHKVIIFESSSELKEVGAGLQLTPNGTRLLSSWGIADRLSQHATTPTEFTYHRYDGRILAHRSNYDSEILNRYGSPIWCLHRADLQKAMVERAVELGASLQLGSRVTNVDLELATLTLGNGNTIRGDIVLAADGLWSSTRNIFMGQDVMPRATGDLAYRLVLDTNDIYDVELQEWLQTFGIHIWAGPGVHAVAYSIKGGRLLNLVLLVPDDLPTTVSRAEGNIHEMLKLFEGWDPILTKFLRYATKVDKWRLNHLPTLETWKTESGSFIMAGDSCHAMLPYMAQGANSSLEDGAAIGALLSHVSSKRQIPSAMALYDAIRRPRLDRLVRETFIQGYEHHLPDGKLQVKRDLQLAKSFRKLDLNAPVEENWSHPKIQPWIFSYNVYETVERAFAEHPF